MSAKNSIQVGIKARPLPSKERDQSYWRVVENSIQLNESHSEPYVFDHIFDQDATNQIIFDKMAKHIVHSSIQGFNGTIFAYGQTSSGKTYTMMGDEDNPGVMVLAAKEIFKEIEKCSDRQFLLRVGYIEIYNEKIYDLFNKKNQDLKIHETATGMVSVNCEENIITSEERLLHHLCMGNKERTVGETNMNERSSRSHAIFRIIIESRKIDRSDEDAVIQSVLNLVDLAGSERADQTGARGARLKEGGHINKSLLFLSNVIKRLSENEDDKYISYRDSKLTRILQASLGGNSLTSIICTIKPTAVEETQSTLSFAMRAKSIKNKPKVNEIVSDATMMKRLESEIKDLKTRLAEERRKNESQIKVGQLEQRIKSEVLKIVSCNSLHNIRNQREKRRRTWCPTTSNPDQQLMQSSMHSALPVPTISNSTSSTIPTRLSKPNIYFTPHIAVRNTASLESYPPPCIIKLECNGNARDTITTIEEGNEQFTPGELCIFEKSPQNSPQNSLNPNKWDDCKTPEVNSIGSAISTPVGPVSLGAKLEIVERALQELQEFTNLENKIDVKHDINEALKQQLELLSNRNAVLENERLEYIQLNNELLLTKDSLNDCEQRCCDLQIEVCKLVNSNKIGNTKTEGYEEQLAHLNETVKKLEMENREAVSLEFEFQRHKNRSKQRESELLDALTEKDKEIMKLEKSLKCVREEKLHSSREELLQLSRGELGNEPGIVCPKCEDLERLLDRNKRVILEFEKLTQEYEKLKQDYAVATSDATHARSKLAELQQNQSVDVAESEKLLSEIIAMREKLETVQREYVQLQCDHNVKTEACEALDKVVQTTREEVCLLQAKYDKLEDDWHEQKELVSDIQADYDAIQLKYRSLQSEYEKLEHTSLEDCARLQQQNECLHVEINELKTRVKEAQKQLLTASPLSMDTGATVAIRQQNEKLQQELLEVQQQFEDMQREYDDLSNQLMDNLQEGETLRDNCKHLEKRVRELEQDSAVNKNIATSESVNFEVLKQTLEDEVHTLKCQLDHVMAETKYTHGKTLRCESIISESMSSSGVGLDREMLSQTNAEVLAKFGELMETLQEIELEHMTGKSRIFRAKQGEAQTNRAPACKLLIRNILEVTTHEHEELPTYGDRLQMQGMLTRHSFQIVEIEDVDKEVEDSTEKNALSIKETLETAQQQNAETQQYNETIAALKQQVQELQSANERLCAKRNSLVQSTEGNIYEMRAQIANLSEELFEKSTFMEDYQKQIESLERERAEMTIVYVELQDKLKESVNDSYAKAGNSTLMNSRDAAELDSELQRLKDVEAKLLANVAKVESELATQVDLLQSKMKEIDQLQEKCKELEGSCLTAEGNILALQTEHEQQLSEVESALAAVKLELLHKGKEYKQECDRLQLELYEKLELNENESRENLRKYNREWEAGKQAYENTIKSLQMQLDALTASCKCSTLQAELEQKHTKTQEMEEALRELEINVDQSALQLKEQTEKHTRLIGKVDALEKEKKELLNEKLKAEEQVVEVHNNVKQLKEEIAKVSSEKAQLEVEKSETLKLEQEQIKLVESLRVELTKLRTENALLQETVSQLQELNKLGDIIACLERDKEQTLIAKEQQLMQLNALQQELLELKEIVLKLQQENTELQGQCVEKSKELHERAVQISNMKNDFDVAQADSLNALAEKNALLVERSSTVEEMNTLRAKLECYETLQAEKAELQKTIENIKIEYDNSFDSLKQERDNLRLSLEQQQEEKNAVIERQETLHLKLETLSQELHDAKGKALAYEKLLNEFKNLEKLNTQVDREKCTLAAQVQELQASLEQKQQSLSELQQLQQLLKAATADNVAATQQQQALQSQLDDLNDMLKAERIALQRQCTDVQSALTELDIKHNGLQEANSQLHQTIGNLERELSVATKKAAACESLNAELARLDVSNGELQTRLEQARVAAAADVAKQQSLFKQQVLANNELHSALASKEAIFKVDIQKLEGTIACLLLEKQSLEEKLHATEILVKKFESELTALQKKSTDSTNNSLDSLNSSYSPRSRRSFERNIAENLPLKSINVNVEDKLSAKQHKSLKTESAERKNRRLSKHDEHRRQSLWGVARDVACMTDPTDTNCICVELDRKLKECQRNLFIRESQVTALNMELKSNPLKAENVTLIKRLQEEQEKGRSEVKRYKQMIVEQKAKMANAVQTAVAAATVNLQPAQDVEAPPKVVGNAETQTDSELEATLRKLEGKYNDVKNICRSRYSLIKELEGKIAQKENAGENVPISSLEVGRMKALESQCESLKKELKVSKQKYEDAKAVLHSRRMEIQQLRAQLAQQ